jgi:hypothetical protein
MPAVILENFLARYIIEICFCKQSVVDHVSFCVSFSH